MCNIVTTDGTAAAQSCPDPVITACQYTTWTSEEKTCTKDSLGDACKCCDTKSSTGLADETGYCIASDATWWKDGKANLEKAFKG